VDFLGELDLGTGVAWLLSSNVSIAMLPVVIADTASVGRSGSLYESTMLIYLAVASWVVVFLAVSLIAAVLGFTAIAGTASSIAWILFAVGLILFVGFAGLGRRTRIEGTMPATESATQVIEARESAMPSRRGSTLTRSHTARPSLP
jgi:uncharacterized membrane protein YtjA (UPF0391 family)